MKPHRIDIAQNGSIYIDGERVIGSKPFGVFVPKTITVNDKELKQLIDRCNEVISQNN